MTINTLDTHQLLGVVNNIPAVTPFWLNLAFPSVQTFDSEWIDFDTVDESRRLAPFVAPNVNGKTMTAEGFNTRRFKPAYIKPKDAVDPSRVIKRRAGEAIGGSLSPEQRRGAVITDILRVQRDMIMRRWEWMAKCAVVDGSVTVSGESYPAQTIAFGRDPSQTVTLSGGTLWSAAGTSHPLTNLQTWYTQTQRLSSTPVRDLVFGTSAWDAFVGHAEVQDKLESRRGSEMALETSTGLGTSDVAQYKGMLPGGPRLWVYSDQYKDDSGAAVDMLDPTYVVGVGQVEGVRAFGAILDARAGYRALEMFPKMWISDDPSVEQIMTQSAPLMIPLRPNATFRAKVV
jgi:hypothetical protein